MRWTRYRSEKPKISLKSWCAMLVTYCPTINQNGRSIWSNDLFRTKIFEPHFFFHVSTKLIHNGIKIMICYKQYQWQFIEAQWVQGAYGEPAFEVLYEIFYIVQPNNISKKTHFDLSTFLKVNKGII